MTADSIKKLEGKSEESATPPGDEDGPRRAPRPPRVPNKRGLNAFTWNLRYPDATFFEGMIFWAGGTTGPVAPPGTYAVRMTVDGDTASRLVQRFVVKMIRARRRRTRISRSSSRSWSRSAIGSPRLMTRCAPFAT